MTDPAILDEKERGLVYLRRISIALLSQLAKISRSQSMFPIHSRREVPRVFLIKGITDNNFPVSIGSALLEVVAIGYSLIIMTAAASSLRTIRFFGINGEGGSIETLQNNLLMGRPLGKDCCRIK